MSLAQIESQIHDLRAQAASIQKRSARTNDILTNDPTLPDVGRQAKREDLKDLAKLRQYQSFEATMAYAWGA